MIFLAGPLVSSAAGQEDLPKGDFSLDSGQMKPIQDPSEIEAALRVAFGSVSVDVKGGKVSCDKTIPTDVKLGAQDFNGPLTLKLDGTYDQDSGAMSGSAELNYDDKMTSQYGNSGTGSVAWRGGFSGQVVGGRASLKLVLRGPSTYTYQGANGRKESGEHVSGGTYGIVYDVSTMAPTAESPAAAPEADKNDSGVGFATMKGQVEIHLPGDPPGKWKVVKLGTRIPWGAHIRTLEDSTVTFRFSDMSTYKMAPETELVIETPPRQQTKAELIAGKIWFNLKKVATDGEMEIDMDQAVCGIKGTTIVAENVGGVSSVKVIEGAVTLTAKTTGETITLTSGETGSVAAGGKPSRSQFDVINEMAGWDAMDPVDWKQYDELAARLPDEGGAIASAGGQVPAKAAGASRFPAAAAVVGVVIALAVIAGAVILRRRKRG